MIARACRVFPGVLVTMCLAGPLHATPAQAATQTLDQGAAAPRQHATEHRRASAAANPRTTATRHARVARREVQHTTVAFIDDGASYSETPSGEAHWSQTGVASWYGGARWQGNRTSSGIAYDENALTAAHATLPLGSKVRVTLHHSDRAVIVTITDRPGTRSRIIDLSRGAAAALGIISQGVAMVTLSPL